ncbi:unnamed protein product [Cladocopium goreaui]|uniref:Thymus-specific serine protease n=1 Tax=Cladocopium goreaui TaxID=2562237 RepID=A0A9P1CK71_9DINO|nr:unnamed protein product [Cladocopium goreaui]
MTFQGRQALADAAAFREFIAAQGLNAAPPLDLRDAQWVTFGGSYSGALSAWARQLYPQHFAAAVASSAPIESQMNFQGFHDVVASSLAAPSVFGTPQCLATISRGHAELGDLLKTERGKRSLEKKFNLCGSNPLDVRQNIGGWAGFGVITSNQYNNNRCPTTSCNIKLLCGNLSAFRRATMSDLDALVMLQQHQREEMVAGGNPNAAGCTDISWQSYLDSMKLIEKHSDSRNFFRIWTYQLCTEWGNFITCDEGSNCPFTRGYNDMDLWYNMCLEVYNISKAQVLANVRKTNEFYGGTKFPGGTQVVFPNGEVDPWHSLSVLVPPNHNIDTIFVKGASHCEWMQAEWDSMPEALRRSKSSIQRKIEQWLLNQKTQEL